MDKLNLIQSKLMVFTKLLFLFLSVLGLPQKTSAATAHFMKSNSAGKYYASYTSSHGCVMVMRGDYFKDRDLLDVAYVSLKDGKVYKDWTSCQPNI